MPPIVRVPPRDEAEFLAFVEAIDRVLRDRDVPIHARPIQAIGEACDRLHMSASVSTGSDRAEPGKYSGDSLIGHINAWYEARYGERLKIYFGPGTIAVMIRGTPWRVRYPRFFGEFQFRLTPLPIPEPERPTCPLVDPLDSVEDLPQGLRTSLSIAEYRDIALTFVAGLEALQALERLKDRPFIHEAIGDQQAAVDHLLSMWPQYGNSRWHSLQFVEKLLKCYLVSSGSVAFPRNHDLPALNLKAVQVGLGRVDDELIAPVACSPGVRYGQPRSVLFETFAAHQASVEVCRIVAPQIDALPPPRSP